MEEVDEEEPKSFLLVVDERQPDLESKEEEEREYFHPASFGACQCGSKTTMDHFRELQDHKEISQWEPISTDKQVILERHKVNAGIYRLKGHTYIQDRSRIIRMCTDVSSRCLWDPLFVKDSIKVIETFEKDSIFVVQCAIAVPTWMSRLGVYNRAAICIVHSAKNWVTYTFTNFHRHAEKKSDDVLLYGWIALYMTNNGTINIMTSVQTQGSQIPGILSGYLEQHFLDILKGRLELFESIDKSWTHYYID